jgi:hypothetical protein
MEMPARTNPSEIFGGKMCYRGCGSGTIRSRFLLWLRDVRLFKCLKCLRYKAPVIDSCYTFKGDHKKAAVIDRRWILEE